MIEIRKIPGISAAKIVDPFYEQEGKAHRARDIDLFFVAFQGNVVVGVCRFCIEEEIPLLRSMVVHAPLRAQKIGTKILQGFETFLDENSYRKTYCIPYSHLGKFYGQIGFRFIKDEEAPVFLQERIRKYRKENPESFMLMVRE